jgi:capsular exopolysaccharide synthesis family protein
VSDTQTSRTSGFELRDYARILWLRKWTVIAITLLVTGGVLFMSYRQTAVYGAKAKVLVPEPSTSVAGGIQVSRERLNLENEAELAASPLIAEAVQAACPTETTNSAGETVWVDADGKELPGPPTGDDLVRCEQMVWSQEIDPYQLIRFVKVAPVKGTQLLLFEAEHPNRARAAMLAHWFGVEYLEYRNQQNRGLYEGPLASINAEIASTEAGIDNLEQQLETLDPESAEYQQALTEIARLNAELTQLKLQRAEVIRARDATPAGAILEDAQIPRKPVRPNHVRDGIIAAIIGLVLGIGAAFLRDYVDDSLRGVDDVERQSGATLIGVIPHVSGAGRAEEAKPKKRKRGEEAPEPALRREYLVALEDPKAPATEAYRTLRTNLLFLGVGSPVRRLVVTSPVLGEGKSTTAANLAVTLAQAGQRVLLVGTDLRRPSVHRFFGLPNRVGLSSLLSGQASLAEAVQNPGVKGLRVMSGGPIPPNPAELLGSRAMKEFLTEAARVTDWVVLDAPPVLGLADASVLASMADGVLFVVNEGTNRRILATARDQLRKVNARMLGTVLNNFGPAFSYYYSDYYAYTSSYYYAEPEERKSRRERRRERKVAKEGGAVTNGQVEPSANGDRRAPDEQPAGERAGQSTTSSSSEGFFFE